MVGSSSDGGCSDTVTSLRANEPLRQLRDSRRHTIRRSFRAEAPPAPCAGQAATPTELVLAARLRVLVLGELATDQCPRDYQERRPHEASQKKARRAVLL